MKIVLQDRDYTILQLITKFRFLLARQIKVLAEFPSQRTCDRRLKKLIESGFITRKYYLYGVPGVYFATEKAKRLFQLKYITKDVRVDKIQHDILVIDTAMYLIQAKNVEIKNITSDREIKNTLGFGNSTHIPDLICTFPNGERYCIEVELHEKAFKTLEKNVVHNFLKLDFDNQIWFVPETEKRIKDNLTALQSKYSGIQIVPLEVIKEFVKKI